MKTNEKNNDKALSAYMNKVGNIEDLLAALQFQALNHFNNSPEEINYGHVGDLGRIENLLKDALVVAK